MSEDIWRWSATRTAAAIRSREISAREAIDAALSRMAAVNAKLNAVTVNLSDAARAASDRSTVTALSLPLTDDMRDSDASTASRAEISRLRMAAATRVALQRQMSSLIDLS